MKYWDWRAFVLASLLLLQVPALLAQSTEEEELSQAYGDKATVSIATGNKQPLRRAPAVASVITAEDIAAMGATDLDQVLETVPGIHVSRIAGLYTPLYIMRGIGGGGATNPQLLMLQNGIPMTAMYTGDKGTQWGGLPVENIARIEIIRGPGSALYGADAYAGVINIITKTAADTQGTQLGMGGGSFGTGDVWVQHGGTIGAINVAGYLRVGHTDGQKQIIKRDAAQAAVTRSPGPVNTGYDAIDGNLDLNLDQWRLRFGYKLRDNLGTGAGSASALDPTSKARSERFTSDLSWANPQFTNNWGLGATLSALYYSEEAPNGAVLFPPGTVIAGVTYPNGLLGGPSRWERQFRFSTFATYSGFDKHALRIGAGHDDLNLYKTDTHKNFFLSPAGVPTCLGGAVGGVCLDPAMDYNEIQPHIRPQRRKNNYLYVQDEWNFAKDWTLTTGLRHDRYSDFGNTTNPRLALVWDAAYNLTAKLLYGTAFRAPSFNEQYGINPVANGNPNLKPETIRTIETAFAWQARKDMQVNLSLFRYVAKDIIRVVSNAPSPGSTYQNTGKQNGHGFELETVWDVDRDLRLTGNYSYQHSVDQSTERDAGYAPHNHFYGRADWRFTPGWLFSPQINWVEDRKRASAFGAAQDTRPDIADYTTVDVSLRSIGGKYQWDFAASIHNLFNANVREPTLSPGTAIPNDLPMAPRSIYLEWIYKL
ncbi:MAG: TonB-dependent receptor [Burkholderiaceae bacterium]|nr:MAG: TonB-dependent receptor [Burkholderiaceae bacterium]